VVAALRLVYGRPGYVLAALLIFPAVALFYAWAAQVLILGSGGVSLLVEPDFIAAILILAALIALSLPLQVYAARLSAAQLEGTGIGVLGILAGTASMSCCAPVILPAILSLLGFSGTAILSVNLTIHRYFLPLALLGIVLLTYSILSTLASLARTCIIAPGNTRLPSPGTRW
jgi:hypothetical protein